jgi:hypothetical protein
MPINNKKSHTFIMGKRRSHNAAGGPKPIMAMESLNTRLNWIEKFDITLACALADGMSETRAKVVSASWTVPVDFSHVLSPLHPSPHEVMEDSSLTFSRAASPFPLARSTVSVSEDHDTENESSAFVSFSSRDMNTAQSVDSLTTQHDVIAPEVTSPDAPSSNCLDHNKARHDSVPTPNFKRRKLNSEETESEEIPKPLCLDAAVGSTSRSCLPPPDSVLKVLGFTMIPPALQPNYSDNWDPVNTPKFEDMHTSRP